MPERAEGSRIESEPPRLAFLVGVAKSGTNWAGSLLNLHSRIRCDGEFHFQYFFEAYRRFTASDWLVGQRPEVAAATKASLEDLVRASMRAVLPIKPDSLWIVDRTPRAFEVLLPGAPHFYILRDARDVLVSFTFHQLRTARREAFPPDAWAWIGPHVEAFQRDPLGVRAGAPGLLGEERWVRFHSRRWADQVRRDLAAVRDAERAPVPCRTLAVRYEDLHADPEAGRRRMYEHLGVDPQDAWPITAESRTAPGFGREDRASFYRKGEVGDWKNFASDPFRQWVKEEAGDVLVELGYERSSDW